MDSNEDDSRKKTKLWWMDSNEDDSRKKTKQ